mmetsp:Transcript_43930/g.42469  ORF Transcript_43930/g.42469 Transcript_43930/m.42469 type:complete len:212 (+) Transcript_43930:2194-2829(+)
MDSDDMEPYNMAEPYKTMAKESLFDRYQYLRHMYTCLFEANQYGGSCIDPLFFYYPEDESLYDNIEESFMVGGALKVSPILAALDGATTFDSYFPEGDWVNLADFSVNSIPDGGSTATLTALNTVNVHLRPGKLIPFQDNSQGDSFTTTDILAKPISLIFNRDSNGFAEGTLLLDDGISMEQIETKKYQYYKFYHTNKAINFFFADGDHDS